MKTRAKKTSDGYILNGSKTWITNAPIADILIIWAKDEENILKGFIVEADTKGLETQVINGKFALRASITGSIFLNDVFVPNKNVLPGVSSFQRSIYMLKLCTIWNFMGSSWCCRILS
jgi:glutaryl-CoA dehydrogenase